MAAARTCPHGCSRCRAIEAAGHSGPYTPREFMDIFELVEQPDRNGTPSELAEAIRDAAVALGAAQVVFEDVNTRWVRLEVAAHRRRDRDPDFEEALAVAAEERGRAGEALTEARATYYELARRDSLRRAREEYEAGQQAMALERAEREQARRERGEGVIARLGRGRS